MVAGLFFMKKAIILNIVKIILVGNKRKREVICLINTLNRKKNAKKL